jgi:hypothetical protein
MPGIPTAIPLLGVGKMEAAMVKLVLCKIRCHNICCLIQEQCELGIEPIFWKEEERQQIEESGYLKVSRA